MLWADNFVTNRRNEPITNSEPDIYTINAHIKFGENPYVFNQFIVLKRK